MTAKIKKKAKKTAPPFRLRVIDLTVALVAILLIAAGIWANTNRSQNDQKLECAKPGADHRVVLSGDSFSPNNLTVQICDRIIVTNTGDQPYELVFGSHDNLSSYPGFSQQQLQPNEYFNLDAVQAGNFVLHDHLHNKAYLHLQINN